MQCKQAGKNKSGKGESYAILFSLSLFSACPFLQVFHPIQMQVKPSESQLAKSRQPRAQSVCISSNFAFLSPRNLDKSCIFFLHSLGQEHTD